MQHRQLELRGLPARGIGDRDRNRLRPHLRAQLPVVRGRIAKARLALLLGSAARQDTQKRILSVDGNRRAQCQSWWNDAVQNDAARARRETAHVLLSDASPVRAAINIDALVPQSSPNSVQVAHSDTRRVVRDVRVRAGFLQAAFGLRNDLRVGRLRDEIVAELAVQRVRTPGPALVDQHDVAIATHSLEDGGNRRVEDCRAHAWAAGEYEQRVPVLVPVDRRDASDVQADVPPMGLCRVFRDSEHTAFGLNRADVLRMLELAWRQRQPRGCGNGRGGGVCDTRGERGEGQEQCG